MTYVMTFVAILILACLFLIINYLSGLAADVRAIRDEVLPNIITALRSQSSLPASRLKNVTFGSHSGHGSFANEGGAFVVWEWRGGKWSVRGSGLSAAFHPGSPPAVPGSFEGDLVRKWVSGAGR